jgi:succinyl-diaminopimelate desuccinylase
MTEMIQTPLESPRRAERITDLTQDLIAIDTSNPPGAELAAAEHLASYFRATGIEATVQRFGDQRANVFARISGSRRDPGLLFSGHLDTVPVGPEEWRHRPLDGSIDSGRLYGRGAVDMKGSVAAMAVILCELHESGRLPHADVMAAFTAGEERDSCGARLLAESGMLDGIGMIVVGEPTGLDVGVAHRGALWIRARALGRRGHGSLPDRSTNAICRLLASLHPIDDLEELLAGVSDQMLGGGSVSLNMIEGGDAPNVTPELATATLDIRTVPGHDHDRLLEALRARSGDISVEVLRDAPPQAVPEDSALARAAVEAVSSVRGHPAHIRGLPYLTDASTFFDVLGVPAVIVGPGDERLAHAVDENVDVDELLDAAATYRHMAEKLAYGFDP